MEIKQVVVTGQNAVELQTFDLNEQVGPDEVLIDTEYTFISAGTELANYTAKDANVLKPGNWNSYPWKSGYANVGIVRKTGADVTKAKVGQRVYTFGKHASAIIANQQELLIEVPADISPAIAASSRMAGVAATSIILSEIPHHAWVAVFGLGMVGNLAAQMFQNLGCRVIGIEPNEHRRQLADRCGLTTTIGGSNEDVREQIKAITGGKLAHITVDAVGHSSVVMQALRSTATFGQIVLLGSPRVPVEGNLTELLSAVHVRWITMRGGLEWCLPVYSELPNVVSLHSKQQLVFDWIREGKLALEPQISHYVHPGRIKEAYDGLLHEPETFTGVVLDWKQL
ncbi:zinc-binding alcohol dehydrogenase [Paenibacillus rhizovicinus]|uniref:Zinc-binding alcohol dehydrogenase n=1 Tax=Paenibacillus rhizovicinus TaxID=2704463 RepID=A0A6C0P0H9_9BACL|nr:zinc-binding alcohol dehydrogenase [Paenibacillus rhizovicinus]QHW31413.1 zinc-binding alcohol dehydrogenase [Paenibacillus rhizovicinus]